MNKLSFYTFRIILWLWDLIVLNLVFLLLAIFVRRAEVFSGNDYFVLILTVNMFWMASGFMTALYLRKNWLDVWGFARETSKSYFLTVLGTLFFMFIFKTDYSRLFITSSFICFALGLGVNRILLYYFLQALRSNFQIRKNVIILGTNPISARLIDYFQKESKLVNVLGVFDPSEGANEFKGVKKYGKLTESLAFARENHVTEIYSTISPEANPYVYQLAKDAESHFIHFKIVPDYRMFVNRNLYVDFVDDMPVLSLRNEPLEDTGNKIKKRLFDIIFSSLVIVFILSWLVPLIGLLIKLSSRGPIFFVQVRSGKSNQPFNCYKFRSLRVNDEANTRQVTKGDRRLTAVGSFLRRTNLDELPQFFNVFMGEMSVVGPRPHMLKHTEDFTNIYKQYMIRHFIKPGLTGWAQVHGYRGEIKDREFLVKRIEHDIWYMENWSIWLDLKIIFMTILKTVQGDEHAY
jgi:putative colanic acid biosynthesis UDP-glucose lipid carrier transferase